MRAENEREESIRDEDGEEKGSEENQAEIEARDPRRASDGSATSEQISEAEIAGAVDGTYEFGVISHCIHCGKRSATIQPGIVLAALKGSLLCIRLPCCGAVTKLHPPAALTKANTPRLIARG